MIDYYKKKIRMSIEKVIGKRILPLSMLPRGVDIYYDIKKEVDTSHFRSVFDVGANEGKSISKYLNWFPKADVYGFEPSENVFPVLKSNFSEHSRANLINTALGNNIGTKELVVGSNSKRGSFHFEETGDEVVNRHCVSIETLDNFCFSNDIDKINFLKIDTEGHDIEVLKGAKKMLSNHRIDFVQSEVTTDYENELHRSMCKMIKYMKKHGYKVYGFYDQTNEWRKEKPYLRRVDTVFVKNSI
jgi:FkbM family methyltransferase